jgi:sirohydrochlorin cobaltochelatase
MHGLILFAHGARDPRWAEPFQRLAATVAAQRPGLPVRLAFLELMEPPLADAAGALVADGCTAVTVLPVFLGTGGHLRRDLPLLMDALRQQHPAVEFRLQPALGEHPAVVAAMAQASLESLGPQQVTP